MELRPPARHAIRPISPRGCVSRVGLVRVVEHAAPRVRPRRSVDFVRSFAGRPTASSEPAGRNALEHHRDTCDDLAHGGREKVALVRASIKTVTIVYRSTISRRTQSGDDEALRSFAETHHHAEIMPATREDLDPSLRGRLRRDRRTTPAREARSDRAWARARGPTSPARQVDVGSTAHFPDASTPA